MTCAECKENRTPETIPYIAHESAMARCERQMKRAFAIIILLIVLLVGSNAAWLYYESQFETIETTQEVTQEADNGTNTFVGGDMNGEANGKDNHQTQSP